MSHLHCHRKRAFFRVPTCKRHPGDVQWMRERGEDLGPDNTKVTHVAVRKLGEAAIKEVARHVQSYSCHDCFASLVAAVSLFKWGGARLYDRYREAIWHGSILIKGSEITSIKTFGGIIDNPEEQIARASCFQVTFTTYTSGDFDGVDIFFADGKIPDCISVTGQLGGYVKVGNALTGNPHKPQPTFSLVASKDELEKSEAKEVEIAGGAELVVSAELLADVALLRKVEGEFALSNSAKVAGSEQAVYFVGREYSGGKVITSPVFLRCA